MLKQVLLPLLKELKEVDVNERINQRIERYSKMGFWDEL
jgi:acetyl-CoA carboxylase carboxyl transferase subunit alpha